MEKSKFFQIGQNGEKIGRKYQRHFFDQKKYEVKFVGPPTLPPPQKKKIKKIGVEKKRLKNEKNQISSKLAKMARKLVKTKLQHFFDPPPKKEKM